MEHEKNQDMMTLLIHIEDVLSNLSVEISKITKNLSVRHSEFVPPSETNLGTVLPIIQDLIGEIMDYGVTLPYSLEMYESKCIREKANYYFANKASISNKKAYLNKLISSLEIKTGTPTKSGSENRQTDGFSESFEESEDRRMKDRREFLTPFISQLTDDLIVEVLKGNQFLRNYCKNVENVRANEPMEFAILDILVKSGRIK